MEASHLPRPSIIYLKFCGDLLVPLKPLGFSLGGNDFEEDE
jgi:hypothetical protein